MIATRGPGGCYSPGVGQYNNSLSPRSPSPGRRAKRTEGSAPREFERTGKPPTTIEAGILSKRTKDGWGIDEWRHKAHLSHPEQGLLKVVQEDKKKGGSVS